MTVAACCTVSRAECRGDDDETSDAFDLRERGVEHGREQAARVMRTCSVAATIHEAPRGSRGSSTPPRATR